MARKKTRKPYWHRTSDNAWYVTKNGKNIPLRDEEGRKIKGLSKAAEQLAKVSHAHWLVAPRFVKPLELIKPETTSVPTFRQLADSYIDFLYRHRSLTTAKETERRLNDFCETHGATPVDLLTKANIFDWLDSHKSWNNNTRATCGGLVVCCINFAVERGLSIKNPLSGIKLDQKTERVTFFNEDQEAEVLNNSSFAMSQALWAMIQTGMRTCEMRTVEAKWMKTNANGLTIVISAKDDEGNWNHKTARATGQARVIVIPDVVVPLFEYLAKEHPTGPLFRNDDGKPWTIACLAQQFAKVRTLAGLPDDFVPYSCRHTFAIRQLQAGVEMVSIAALLGNSVTVCEKTYANWRHNSGAVLAQARRKMVSASQPLLVA